MHHLSFGFLHSHCPGFAPVWTGLQSTVGYELKQSKQIYLSCWFFPGPIYGLHKCLSLHHILVWSGWRLSRDEVMSPALYFPYFPIDAPLLKLFEPAVWLPLFLIFLCPHPSLICRGDSLPQRPLGKFGSIPHQRHRIEVGSWSRDTEEGVVLMFY